MQELVAIVLAAGEGRRMRSPLPKVLHHAAGRSLVDWVLAAAAGAGVERTVVVVGHGGDEVRRALAGKSGLEFAVQPEQLGTGHAVLMCRDQLRDHHGGILVLNGDTPLVRADSLAALVAARDEADAACVIGTARTAANQGLGRVLRDDQGEFVRIVEEADATPEGATIEEINTGSYVFDGGRLWAVLDRLQPDNRQAQYYLTDCAAILRQDGHRVIAGCTMDAVEAMGVNTPEQLEAVERLLADG